MDDLINDDGEMISAEKALIATRYRELTEVLQDFAASARKLKSECRAEVYVLPLITDTKHERELPTPIKLVGDQAFDKAISAILAIDYQPEQNPATTFRAPGIIALPPEVRDKLPAVNAAKNRLKQAIADLGQKNWQNARKSLSKARSVCLLQAYRHLRTHQDVKRISFGWDLKGANGRQMSVDQVRKLIYDGGHMEPLTQEAEDKELAQLATVPKNEILLRRRPIAPVPTVNISSTTGHANRHFRVALPIIIPSEQDWPIVRGLLKPVVHPEDDNTDDQTSRIDRKTEQAPLIERINIHRYLEAHRVTAAELPVAAHVTIAHEGSSLLIEANESKYTVELPGGHEDIKMLAAAIKADTQCHLGTTTQLRYSRSTRTHAHCDLIEQGGIIARIKWTKTSIRKMSQLSPA